MKKNIKMVNLNKKNIIAIIGIILVIAASIRVVNIISKGSKLSMEKPSNLNYEVFGVDISHHNGNIRWNDLANNGISFAFIKSTEGSSHKDKNFDTNWKNSKKAGITTGAYHFMSFESPGVDQAKNYIKTVPKEKDSLPPVVDFEYYGKFENNHPSQETVDKILKPLLKKLKDHYGKDPIIYVNSNMYKKYISGKYKNRIWLADLKAPKKLPDGRSWEFLQYSFNSKLTKYAGGIPHLDLNVFRGSRFSFAAKYL